MKQISWIVKIDGMNLAIAENGINLPPELAESHLAIIGVLENLKQMHLAKLQSLFNQTVKKDSSEHDAGSQGEEYGK